MGFLLDGRCPCGHSVRGLRVGVGMKDRPGTWLSPCHCSTCGEVVAANVQAAPIVCPRCGKQGAEALVDPSLGCEADEAFPSCQASEPLMERAFACPKCDKRSLRFEFAGLWD